jgi:uncharacterized protein YkwD
MPPRDFASALLALSLASCGTGNKTVDAIGTAAIAGALTMAEVSAAQRAARNAPYGEHPSGCGVSDCYSDPDLSLDEARNYALLYVNRARDASGAGAVSLDFGLNAFAQAGSKQLASDHRPHQHVADDPRACFQCSEEQSDPQGLSPAPVRDQVLGVLDGMMSQGPGGASHDNILAPGWHRLGVGIANPDGLTYVTLDFAP